MGVVRTRKEPPTYYPTNKFTECTQGIIDSYGVARYGEVNPGFYTVFYYLLTYCKQLFSQ